MENFKKRQIAFLLQLVGVSVLLFAIHSYLLYYFAKEITFFFPLWKIYTFHLIITLALYTIVNYRFSSGKKDIFNKQPDVFNFFIPYFLYLFFEVFALTKFLQKP